MFERFTDRARMVVSKAQAEAMLLGHSYIGTEHLLLGMLAEGDGIAGKALTDIGLTLESVRAAVEQVVGRGEGVPAGQHIPFTKNAKNVLEQGLRQALHLGHSYIGTEHLLLGLPIIEDSTAEKVLERLGIETWNARKQVLVRLGSAELFGVGYVSIPQLELQLDIARARVEALEQELANKKAERALEV